MDKAAIIRQIEQIQPRGSTDLHGGWVEGGRQAEAGRVEGAINRVLLLSDGQANVGVTDPNTLATEARGLAARGVGTTTLGVGDDYNEDLMEAMATAGDGNYYYIESPAQLVDLFQTELQGLMATLGQKVSLGLEPQGGAAVSDVLNDFEKAPTGRSMLPNLIVGMPVQVIVRLSVPVRPGVLDLLTVRLAWDDPRSGERRVLHASLGAMPAVPMTEWSNLPVDPDVREQEALLMIARAEKEASRAHERGDIAGTVGWMGTARGYVAGLASSPAIADELQAIDQMDEALGTDDAQHFRKLSKFRSYLRQASRPSPPLATPPEPPTPSEPPAGS